MAAYYYTVLTVLIFARDSKVLVYVSIHIKQTTSSIPGAMPFLHFSTAYTPLILGFWVSENHIMGLIPPVGVTTLIAGAQLFEILT
jgi:hypothetical protein